MGMGLSLFSENGALRFSQFFVAAVVTARVDEFLGGGEVVLRTKPSFRIFLLAEEEAGAMEVDVGQEKFHGAALGDFAGFIQILLRALGPGRPDGEKSQPGAGEQTASDEFIVG